MALPSTFTLTTGTLHACLHKGERTSCVLPLGHHSSDCASRTQVTTAVVEVVDTPGQDNEKRSASKSAILPPGASIETSQGTLYVSKPVRSRSSKKLRAMVTFSPRKSVFDISNEQSGTNEFRVRPPLLTLSAELGSLAALALLARQDLSHCSQHESGNLKCIIKRVTMRGLVRSMTNTAHLAECWSHPRAAQGCRCNAAELTSPLRNCRLEL